MAGSGLRSPPLAALALTLVTVPTVWIGARVIDQASISPVERAAALPAVPPAPQPMTLRPLAPAAAIEINRQIPFADTHNPPARPFVFRGAADMYDRALTCLTEAVYYEAASEPEEGQRAVAQVVLNRVRHPAFPGSVCAVVYQGSTLPTGCQFTFTCDGSLARTRSSREWARAEGIAAAALMGSVFPSVGHALNYHANFVIPYWATSLSKKAVVGTHIFYRVPGPWGDARAFRRLYAGAEANPIELRAIAMAARERAKTRRGSLPQPLITAAADPRVELVGVVGMLASNPTPAETDDPLVTAARAEFNRFSTHPAVEMYRELEVKDQALASRLAAQLVESPPQPDGAALEFPSFVLPGQNRLAGTGLAGALRAFASETGFAGFFAKHQAHYRALRDAHRTRTLPVVGRFEKYTGLSAGSVRLVVAPLSRNSFVANCYFEKHSDAKALVVLAGSMPPSKSVSPSKPASLLVDALALKAVAAPECGVPFIGGNCRDTSSRTRIIKDQIVRALTTRVVPTVGLGVARRKGDASSLAALINESLKSYERNRDYFPTFRDFQPVLLATLARTELGARLPNGSVAARLKVPAAMRSRARASSDPVCDA